LADILDLSICSAFSEQHFINRFYFLHKMIGQIKEVRLSKWWSSFGLLDRVKKGKAIPLQA
jgi:hypothetical protein